MPMPSPAENLMAEMLADIQKQVSELSEDVAKLLYRVNSLYGNFPMMFWRTLANEYPELACLCWNKNGQEAPEIDSVAQVVADGFTGWGEGGSGLGGGGNFSLTPSAIYSDTKEIVVRGGHLHYNGSTYSIAEKTMTIVSGTLTSPVYCCVSWAWNNPAGVAIMNDMQSSIKIAGNTTGYATLFSAYLVDGNLSEDYVIIKRGGDIVIEPIIAPG
jgi:hypothetical protein